MTAIEVLGTRLPPLARIAETGAVLGLGRGASYRASADWPLVGPETNRRVIVPRLLDELGIAYSVTRAPEQSDDAGTR